MTLMMCKAVNSQSTLMKGFHREVTPSSQRVREQHLCGLHHQLHTPRLPSIIVMLIQSREKLTFSQFLLVK